MMKEKLQSNRKLHISPKAKAYPSPSCNSLYSEQLPFFLCYLGTTKRERHTVMGQKRHAQLCQRQIRQSAKKYRASSRECRENQGLFDAQENCPFIGKILTNKAKLQQNLGLNSLKKYMCGSSQFALTYALAHYIIDGVLRKMSMSNNS